jgi:lipopolysaccharide biosynthesis regulator YciM
LRINLPLILLGAIAFAYGVYVGKVRQREQMREQADALHDSIAKLVSASAALRQTAAKLRKPVTTPDAPKVDTVASEPLRFKRGDADRALRDGNLALLKDYEGQDN